MTKNSARQKKLAAFTLIEILVTVTLTSIIMLGITTLFITLITSAGKSRLSQNIRENGTVAMQKMIEELRNAKAIDSTIICDGNESYESLSFVNDDELISSFAASDNRINLEIDGSNYYLTSDSNELRGLEFVCYDTDAAKYIEISFSLASSTAATNSPTHSQLDFKSGVALRN